MRERMQRFSNYMDFKGLNDNQVTIQCGLSQGLLGQARKGKSDLGNTTIDKILTIYQDLNRVWLLTGAGSMLSISDNCQQDSSIPYYNIDGNASGVSAGVSSNADDASPLSGSPGYSFVRLIPTLAQGGSFNDFVSQVRSCDCEQIVSPVKGADFAIQVTGVSMAPEYPEGSRVFIKHIKDKSFIEWGKAFVLDTCNGAVLKVLTPSDKENCVRCVSLNPDPIYAPFDVNLEDVYGIYRVLLCMSMK